MTDKRTLDNLRYWCNCTERDMANLDDLDDCLDEDGAGDLPSDAEVILALEKRLQAATCLIALYDEARESQSSLTMLSVAIVASIGFILGGLVGMNIYRFF